MILMVVIMMMTMSHSEPLLFSFGADEHWTYLVLPILSRLQLKSVNNPGGESRITRAFRVSVLHKARAAQSDKVRSSKSTSSAADKA